MVAIATSDGKNIDRGFGNAPRFDIYSFLNGKEKFLRTVETDTSGEVAKASHKKHIENIADLLEDCSDIVVKEIGPMPSKLLADRGKAVHISSGAIEKETFWMLMGLAYDEKISTDQ
jgi:nitrogen fixation protein NifB